MEYNSLVYSQQQNLFTHTHTHHGNPNLHTSPRDQDQFPLLVLTMSSVLSMQIAHTLFPSFFNTNTNARNNNSSPYSSSPRIRSTSSSIPRIAIEPAEDTELRPLLSALSRQPATRHRRSFSASSTSSERRSHEGVAPFPHIGFATMVPR
jgi:hypothetical protein